ncbi:hypothetical protein B0O99DRAFT_608002 [Bisporella sp. PMI_857]|nr:hypothetical protein B0O99DRAFT_608002 [Bisporella sp. PMI_857]
MTTRRYEPIPQNEEVINLDALQNNASYNYNSGLGNSAPSSVVAPSYTNYVNANHQHHAPSIRSIPNSPPPSFHTISSPGTPRPIPSTTTRSGESEYAELWGVAASTRGAQTEVCAGSEAKEMVSQLMVKVERLEEAIGRLLLEKETEPEKYHGANCCLTFTDASPAAERAITSAGGNCCITFRHSGDYRQRDRKAKMLWLLFSLIICLTFVFSLVVVKKAGADVAGIDKDDKIRIKGRAV